MRVLSDESDDDKPLVAHATTQLNGHAPHPRKNGKRRHESESADDAPLVKRVKSEPSRAAVKRKAAPESSDEDIPLSSPAKSAQGAEISATRVNGNGTAHKHKEESSDDDRPLVSRSSSPRKPAVPIKKAGRKKARSESHEEDDGGDDYQSDETPKKKKAPAKAQSKPAPKKKKKVKDESDNDDMPIATKAKSAAAAAKKPRKKKADDVDSESPQKKKKTKEEEDEAELYRWWEAQDVNGDGTTKWQTLEHNGVLFPPPYEPLPDTVKMKYNGQDVDLPPESEEVAWFFAQLLDSDHAQDATFQKNFFRDFEKVLKVYPPRDGTKIYLFEKCDFRPMLLHWEADRAAKKALPAAEKKELKRKKDELEAPFKECVLDGRKEKVGNFRIEPPGLFRGRGEHPKKGSLKVRVRPEDITINIGRECAIPVPAMPGNWANVQHDQTVTWLACWKENVNGQFKYVFLAAGSSLKGQSDLNKFEKARELKKHVDAIRRDYEADLKSKIMADRQRATAMYFIDKLALRAGNEKGEDEADTVGCCSLRCEHVTLEAPDQVIFDFLGKDSIRYYNRVQVIPQVFKNIRLFKGDEKTDDDALFDRVTTASLNKHLQSYMKGLTAKVFRTYNASTVFQTQLDGKDLSNASVAEKIAAYNDANREVAILCNHQRSVPKTHSASMQKLEEKLKAMKYDRMKLRHALFTLEPKMRKQRKDLTEMEEDLDDEWIAQHENAQRKLAIEKAEKKFEKENEKLLEDGGQPQKASVLEGRLAAIKEEYDRLEQEQGTESAVLKSSKTAEQIETMIAKQDERIKTFQVQLRTREEMKEVSLGTSKINYLDPRITAAWCKKHGVPVEKLFSKTLLTKFPWAMGVEEDWEF